MRAIDVLPEFGNCVFAPHFSDIIAPDAFSHAWTDLRKELSHVDSPEASFIHASCFRFFLDEVLLSRNPIAALIWRPAHCSLDCPSVVYGF